MAVRPLLSDPPILLPVRAAAGGALWVLARPASTDCQDRIPRTRLWPEHQSGFAKDLDAYPDALAVKAMQGNDRRGA